MSAHHPKASMIGATSVSTPMVRNPNERRVNIAAAGLAQIEAIMATGKGFEEAYAEAWRREVKPNGAAYRNRPPSPPAPEPLPVKSKPHRKARILESLKGGEMFWAHLCKLVSCREAVMLEIIGELVSEGRVTIRKDGRYTLVRIVGASKNVGKHPASTALVWEGTQYPSISACARAEGLTPNSIAKALIQRDGRATKTAPKATRGKPRTIDGITFGSLVEAAEHFGRSVDTVRKWADTGKSTPDMRGFSGDRAHLAFDPARTRKNSQTQSSGAISQSGAQMGGL
jgi:hypothetical protein